MKVIIAALAGAAVVAVAAAGYGQVKRDPTLDKLAVLLGVFAFHHHHQIVLSGKLVLEPEEILMVLLVRANQIIAARIELEMPDREVNAGRKEQELRIEIEPPKSIDRVRQSPKDADGERIGRRMHR